MSANPEASNKARAISRGADLIAAYASDARGWASPKSGREVFDERDPLDEGDLYAIAADAITDILHTIEHIGADPDDLLNTCRNHYIGERDGDLDTAWRNVPDADVEYVPAINSTGPEPLVVVVRHPDWGTDTTLHYIECDVVDIDLGGSFDITHLYTDDIETAREYAADLRKQVEHLPADHTGRVAVVEQAEHIEQVIA